MTGPKKYTKIPVEVEAMQWNHKTTMREMQEFTNNLVRLNDVDEEFYVYDRLHDTWVKFAWNDWIIKGVKGEFYPCAELVFATTYKVVPEKTLVGKKRESNDPERPPKGPGSGSIKPGAEINIYPAVHVQESPAQAIMRQGYFDPYRQRS